MRLFCFAFLLAAGSATAQPAAPPNASPDTGIAATVDQDWAAGQITVTGHFPGPALWRVRKGDSEVYIVGGLPVMIKRFDWDRGRVGRILDKANVLLVAPQAKGGPISFASWEMSKGAGPFRNLWDLLPGDVASRFRTLAVMNGVDPDAYAHDQPVVAAMRLRDDIYEKRGFSTNDPEKMLIFMARDRKTPMRPVGKYSAASAISKLNGMSKAERINCVVATLNEIEFATRHAQTATQAWAVGDLKTAQANSPASATMACLEGSGSTQALLGKAIDDSVAAVDAALTKPGKSVVVFPLTVLLQPDGALSRLQAQGAEVTVPAM
jgi:uncharacterized protein YbaP (TraB family)